MMTEQWLFIEPNDVWLFRDNKPFTAAANFVARSIFPPLPTTTQGALRTLYLSENGIDLAAYGQGEITGHIIGTPSQWDAGLSLLGPVVARMRDRKTGVVEPLIHAPLDLVYQRELKSFSLLRPGLESAATFVTDPPFPNWRPLMVQDEKAELEETPYWLTPTLFEAYLGGEMEPLNEELREALRILEKDKHWKSDKLLKADQVFEFEDRPGLGMDHARRTNQESLFYRADFVRPCAEVGLLVCANQPLAQASSGVMTIGGESRGAHYQQVEPNWLWPMATDTSFVGNVRIILLTPAYFGGGWMPEDGKWSRWVGAGELVSAVVGKPQLISGWDMTQTVEKPGGQERALHAYVPAGSVYYFRNATVSGEPFTETPPADTLSRPHDKIGFGTAAIGTW